MAQNTGNAFEMADAMTLSQYKDKSLFRPTHVPEDIWDSLTETAKLDITRKLNKKSPIKDISDELWLSFEQDTRDQMTKVVKPEASGSNIYNFFCGGVESIDDGESMEGAVNAMALVNALLLTIPYGVIGIVSQDFFDSLESNFNSCPDEQTSDGQVFKSAKERLINSIAGTLYACLCGLIMATFYYLFRPPRSFSRSDYAKRKDKVLLCLMFFSTASSIVCAMNVATLLISYFTVQSSDFCDAVTNNVWGTGVALVIIALFAGAALMN